MFRVVRSDLLAVKASRLVGVVRAEVLLRLLWRAVALASTRDRLALLSRARKRIVSLLLLRLLLRATVV